MMDQQVIKHTPAEQALISAYLDAVGRMHGTTETAILRDKAIETIKAKGLPSRRVEAWHYTDLRTLLRAFHPVAPRPDHAQLSNLAAKYEYLVDSARVALFDGNFFGDFSDPLPDRVTLRSFAATAEEGGDIGIWEFEPDEGDTITSLNTAFFRDGLELKVDPGAKIEKPVTIDNIEAGQSETFAAMRNIVTIGDGAKVTFIERHLAPTQSERQNCAVTRLDVGEGAEVTWLIVQEGGEAGNHFGQIRISLGKDAKLTLFIMNAGGKLVRQEIIGEVIGEGADFQMRGVNLLAGDTHTDVTMIFDHKVPHTTSTEIIRNIVMDSAQGAFQGQIKVHQEAQKTDARMACNTLLLSDDGGFSTKPELEIFADDVQCGHGATVAEIDHNQLFYMMSRGMGEKDARRLLVKAFLREIIEELEDEALVEALENKLDLWFAEHG
jgi:Fe-S cluster assembly protein SufD